MEQVYRGSTVNVRRTDFTDAGHEAKVAERVDIQRTLTALREKLGGKNLASHFDGREGKEVAESTLSRWSSDARRFPAVFLGVLCELDPEFRRRHIQRLVAWGLVPNDVLDSLPEQHRETVRAAMQERALSMVFTEVSPGKVVRR